MYMSRRGEILTHHCGGGPIFKTTDCFGVNKYALEKIGENKAKCGVIAISVISCPPTHKDHKKLSFLRVLRTPKPSIPNLYPNSRAPQDCSFRAVYAVHGTDIYHVTL